MRISTHTLDLDPAVDWHLVGIPKTRWHMPVVVVGTDTAIERERTIYERTVSDSLGAQIRTRLSDAVEFAFLSVTLVAIGWLHFELLAQLW